jgi:hypothetical protein
MDAAYRLREEAREHERIASLEREEARIDRLIAQEEIRRMDIAKRLQVEVKRLEALRRAT